jgi:hypothetical protein
MSQSEGQEAFHPLIYRFLHRLALLPCSLRNIIESLLFEKGRTERNMFSIHSVGQMWLVRESVEVLGERDYRTVIHDRARLGSKHVG